MQSRHKWLCGGGPLSGFLALLRVRIFLSLWLRPLLRATLRPSLPLSLRGPIRPEAREPRLRRRLRAWRFADIPTPLPVQNIKSVTAVLIALSIFSASLALDACAIASALAPQRFSAASATVVASTLATTQTPIDSALASQRFAVTRLRARRSV